MRCVSPPPQALVAAALALATIFQGHLCAMAWQEEPPACTCMMPRVILECDFYRRNRTLLVRDSSTKASTILSLDIQHTFAGGHF